MLSPLRTKLKMIECVVQPCCRSDLLVATKPSFFLTRVVPPSIIKSKTRFLYPRCDFQVLNIEFLGETHLYLALGNIALVFAALTSRDSEIAGISIRIYYGIAIRIGYGIPIVLVIHSVDPSLSSQLILPFMGCFGDCLNHGFSLIKRITRITGSLWDLYRLHYPFS